MATETKTFYPGAYDASSSNVVSIANEAAPVGKGTSNTSYASFAYGTAFWSFDVSSIPLDAEINSVSCEVKAKHTAVSGTVSLCSGSTEKGSATSTTASATVHTLSTGTWTREELSLVRLKFVLGGTNTSRKIYFYGADLTVTYTYQSEKFMLKLGGAYNDIVRTFKKVSGIWVEQTELANVVDQTKRLVNGGEYVVELPEGYTRLEYIESTGSQYIDTGFVPNQDTGVNIVFAFSDIASNNFLFGSRYSSTSQNFSFLSNAANQRFGYNTAAIDAGDDGTDKRTVKIDKNKCYTNGVLTATATYAIFDGYASMYLFGVNAESGEYRGRAKIYSCEIFDNGIAVRKFYPCLDPLGVPGMYDTVNGVFYSSKTGIDFMYPGSVSLINFTINGASYQAEEGMNWSQWVSSAYNSAGFYVYNSAYIYSSSGMGVALTNGTYVNATDVITSGYAYKLSDE